MRTAVIVLAWAAWLVPLSMLAVSAWLPGELTGGVDVLDLATSRVFPLVTAIGVAMAGIVLGRIPRMPGAARWAVGALAGYAVIAFVNGAVSGVPLPALLAGRSLWTPLPFVLQGAVVGALLILPLAIVASVAAAGLRAPVQGSAARTVRQACAMALTLAVVLAALPRNDRSVHQTASAETTAAAPPAKPLMIAPLVLAPLAVPDGSLPTPMQMVERADRLRQRIVRSDWDVGALAQAMSPGIGPAFELVRDRIGYEPYAGVLRGAAGTYAARAGNSVDRALLLAGLLAQQGIRTQFALGILPDTTKTRLLARAFERGAQEEALRPLVPTAGSAAFHDRVLARAQRDYRAIREALADRLVPVSAPSRDDVLAEMNPHVWVQAWVDRRWLDLDPSFEDSRPGTSFTTVDQTTADIPPELHQTVTIRLTAERVIDGTLVASPLVSVTRPAVALIDRQVFIVHTQGAGDPFSGLAARFEAALSGGTQQTWTTNIWIDGELVPGRPLDIAAPNLVAEFLEFDLTWPGGRRETTRRPLADRAGFAWRSAQRLDVSVLPAFENDDAGALAFQAVHNIWFSAGRHNLADFDDAAQDLLERAFLQADDAGGASDFADQVWPFALQNFAWMVWTDHVVVPSLNDTSGVRLYADGPRIAVFTRAPTLDGVALTVSDLRRDDLRGVVDDVAKAALLAERKLLFGLLQGALEYEALAEYVAVAEEDLVVDATSSRLTADGLVLLAPETGIGNLPPGVHPESVVRIAAALGRGRVVVAPLQGLDEDGSWWEIVPGSGDTRSIGAMGLHSGRTRPRIDFKGGVRHTPRPPRIGGGGGANVHLTPEAEKEAFDEFMRTRNAQREAANVREWQRQQLERANQLSAASRKPRSGENAVVLAAIALAKWIGAVFVKTVASWALVYVLYMSVGLFLQYLGAP
jgi:hypothetical protein